MKAAIVDRAGATPRYGAFAEPVAEAGERRIAVSAAALSPLTRARASGRHYSAEGAFPFVAGVDGVGLRDDGQRCYFLLPRTPFGAMAERTVAAHHVAVPDALDDVTAAAIANPAMSSWAALVERAKFDAGETVLVNGATGASGRLAVQVARYLGAGKVIATGRDAMALAALGADAALRLDDAEAFPAMLAEQVAHGIDVVIDYLWGASAAQVLAAAAGSGREGVPLRFVQVGTASAAEIVLPGALLRASGIVLMGSGLGSVPLDRLLAAISGVFDAAATGALHIETCAMPLTDVAAAWAATGSERVVLIVGDRSPVSRSGQ